MSNLRKLEKRLEKTVLRGGVITRAKLLADAKTYKSCPKALGKEPSERFASAYRIAAKACQQFTKAAAELAKAAANVDASGAVVAGTPQEAAFERALERGGALAGNGLNTISNAVVKADAVEAALPA